jgi:ABC-2 type transport system ATP-binding protein
MHTASDGPAGIRLDRLSKAYGAAVAVDGLSLSVRPGDIVALLGPNGAGKSTTIDMLLGLTRPDSGSVTLWGLAPHDACRRGFVGAMLQGGGVLGGVTVRELVEMMRQASPHALPLQKVVDIAQLGDIVDTRADRLSGGQTQRVRLALAVAGDPELLVLDEPTAAMDVASRRAFWVEMHDWADRGRTIMFATHYLEEADAFADRVVLMARGRVVADGTPTEVKAVAGGRVVRATLPAADLGVLSSLPGVSAVDQRGDAVILRCADADSALRALLLGFPAARDIEVTGVGLDDAFLTLTGSVLDRADSEQLA